MALEIERKFLVRDNIWRPYITGSRLITQGYLAREKGNAVRIRIEGEGTTQIAILCVKGPSSEIGTPEFEYPVPLDHGLALLELCGSRVLSKLRHLVPYANHTFEVDEFQGNLAPFIMAEVEMTKTGESVQLPSWIGREVTADSRYTNASIVEHGVPSH